MISVVIPAFNESENLDRLVSQLVTHLDRVTDTWEVIFVDDGSCDNTWVVIESLSSHDIRFKGIRFARNFGHQYALIAGLSAAKGDAVICMDSDLQHPPALITRLVKEWRGGSKIVNTVRLDSNDATRFKRVTSRWFYSVFSYLSGVKLSSGMADFRLFDREALNAVLSFGEQGLFLRGVVQWIGFNASTVTFRAEPRYRGTTKYTLRKMLRFSMDGITSFSLVPLRVGILLGLATSAISFVQLVYALYAKVVLSATVPGWATTIAVMSFMFGVLFVLLGILGEYIGRILIQVRNRPRFIVSQQCGFGSEYSKSSVGVQNRSGQTIPLS